MRRSFVRMRGTLLALLGLALIVSACGSSSTPEVSPTETPVQPARIPPTPTLTPEPPKVLNICLAEDPGSLYRFEGRDSLAKQSVFSALYYPSALFATVPGYANNLAFKTIVDVRPGMNVLDGSGQVTILKEGSLVHPVIDESLGEPTSWSSSDPLKMMQVKVDYKITPGLLWSDGSPVTPADFLLAYDVAAELRNPQDIWLLDRTASVEVLDETTLTWTGIPGFVPVDLSGLIFSPLPAAQFVEMTPAEIGMSAQASQTPIGWGAYRIVERESGSVIWMERNPYYSPKPAYDQVIFKVKPDLEQAIRLLQSGDCDVLDPSYHLEAQSRDALTELAETGTLVAENFELVQQLVFGIQPAA